MSRVTIREVAKEAGVSLQTISRVINNRPDVSPETRKRIEGVIARLGYEPSALAQSLPRKHSATLGVITAGLKHVGPARTLNGITQAAENFGYTLIIKELSSFETEDIDDLFRSLRSHHVDGIIWGVPQIDQNRAFLFEKNYQLPLPVVFLMMEDCPNVSIISAGNFSGARKATQHLIDQGYQHIGHISGPLGWWSASERKKGWESALHDAGRAADAHCWVEGNWSPTSGAAALRQMMSQYPELDAVFVANDQMALGVLQVAHLQQIKIPDELGVVGFDNIPESEFFFPPLTTISQDQNEIGRMAVSELIKLIEQYDPLEARIQHVELELIVRGTSIKQK
jgi:LacI family transcriptional regulator